MTEKVNYDKKTRKDDSREFYRKIEKKKKKKKKLGKIWDLSPFRQDKLKITMNFLSQHHMKQLLCQDLVFG